MWGLRGRIVKGIGKYRISWLDSKAADLGHGDFLIAGGPQRAPARALKRLAISPIVATSWTARFSAFTVLSRNDGHFPLILSETRRKYRCFLPLAIAPII